MSNPISTNIRTEDAHNWLGLSEIPGNESLIPPSCIDHVLVLRVLVELAAINSVGMAIVRSIGLLQFYDFFPFDLIVDPDNRLTTSCN